MHALALGMGGREVVLSQILTRLCWMVRSAVRSSTMCAGASNVHRSPQTAAVVAYEAALSPPRARVTAAAEQHGEQAQQDAALRHEQHMQAASPNTSPRKR